MFEKELLKASVVSKSLSIIWPFSGKFILSLKIMTMALTMMTLQSSKKDCCQLCPLHSSSKNNSFWVFFEEEHSNFLNLYTRSRFCLLCS